MRKKQSRDKDKMTESEENYYRNKTIRMCGAEPESIVDGPGFRYVLFVQGCPHHCRGCHNPETWDTRAGYEISVGEVCDQIRSNPNLRGITLSGGEPFEQADALLALSKLVKAAGLTLMGYSGYTLEELIEKNDEAINGLLNILDILVDGRYIEEQRNLTLIYRGSENQRVIDMNKSKEEGRIVLYHSDFDDDIII